MPIPLPIASAASPQAHPTTFAWLFAVIFPVSCCPLFVAEQLWVPQRYPDGQQPPLSDAAQENHPLAQDPEPPLFPLSVVVEVYCT